MAIPQTPDSIRKSQDEKTPPPPRDGDEDRKLSTEDVPDDAEERQGGL